MRPSIASGDGRARGCLSLLKAGRQGFASMVGIFINRRCVLCISGGVTEGIRPVGLREWQPGWRGCLSPQGMSVMRGSGVDSYVASSPALLAPPPYNIVQHGAA